MLQLNYKLTDEDYIEFNEFHQLIHSEIGKRNLFFFKINRSNDQYSSYDHFHTSKSRSNVNYW